MLYSHERGYIQSYVRSNIWHAHCQLVNWRYVLDHLDCSPGAPAVFYLRKQISLPITEHSCWNLPLWKFPWPFGFQIVSLWLTESKSGWIYFETEVHLPIFRESCSNFELMRILLIIWIAARVHWQYCYSRKKNSLPINEGSCRILPLSSFPWPFGFQIVYVWLT